MTKLKCLVVLGHDYPELLAEIHSIPSRERASRFRLLAHTGLISIHGSSEPILYSSDFIKKPKSTLDIVSSYESLKCLILLGNDYSELLSEILATPSRERAARLRMLAHTGLILIRTLSNHSHPVYETKNEPFIEKNITSKKTDDKLDTYASDKVVLKQDNTASDKAAKRAKEMFDKL